MIDRRILTGAPGTGKTALLGALDGEITWVAEPAREILAERPSPPERAVFASDPDVFVGLLLERSIAKYHEAGEGLTVFDRGIPDCIAYALQVGADPDPSIRAAPRYRYHPEVLLLTPWEEIYTTDDERMMTFGQVEEFHGHLETAYEIAGYDLVEVPSESIDERAAFVKSRWI